MAGYQLVHHGEGRWNGVAIAVRNGLSISDIVTNFGDGPVRDSGPGGAGAAAAGEDDFDPFDEARMVAATVDGLRVASVYVPNGRVVDSPFYLGKLAWLDRLARWIRESDALDLDAPHGGSFVIGGDFNVAPTDIDVWDPAAAHGGTHVSERERAAVATLVDLGLTDAYRASACRDRPLHVVGLPGRHVPQELRDADRPAARLRSGRRAARGRRDRSGSAQGTAGPVGPRAAAPGPRRGGPAARCRLERRAQPDRRQDSLTPVRDPRARRIRSWLIGLPVIVWRGIQPVRPAGRSDLEEALV